MLIPQDDFQRYFNLQTLQTHPDDYERACAIAEDRFVKLLRIKEPDFTLPSSQEELTPIQKELLMHLILIEILKTDNYVWEENKGRVSIKRITSQADRLTRLAHKELK
ncbi:MAG: hypothetical protein ABGX12_06590 [Desulfurobacteriaceae bacterium]